MLLTHGYRIDSLDKYIQGIDKSVYTCVLDRNFPMIAKQASKVVIANKKKRLYVVLGSVDWKFNDIHTVARILYY